MKFAKYSVARNCTFNRDRQTLGLASDMLCSLIPSKMKMAWLLKKRCYCEEKLHCHERLGTVPDNWDGFGWLYWSWKVNRWCENPAFSTSRAIWRLHRPVRQKKKKNDLKMGVLCFILKCNMSMLLIILVDGNL